MLEQEGLLWALGVGRGMSCGSPGLSQSSRPLLLCCLHKCQQWPLLPHSDAILGVSQLCPSQLHTPLSHYSRCSSVELCHGARVARVGARLRLVLVLGWLWETGQSSGQFQSASCTLFWELASVCVLFMSRV